MKRIGPFAMRWCLFLLPVSAWAEIAGVPIPPTPRDIPDLWVSFSDDLLGDGILNTDDYRTGNVSGGLSIGCLVLGGDYSVLTHRVQPSYAEGTRSDEATLTAGVRLDELMPNWMQEHCIIISGIGVRIDGDLGGEHVQNTIHREFGYPQTALAYDHYGQASKGLAYTYASVASDGYQPTPDWAPLRAEIDGGVLATTAKETQEYLGVYATMVGDEGSAWLGGYYQWNDGTPASPTALVVAEHESGMWLVLGVGKRNSLYLSAEVNPQRHAINGTIGYALDDAELEGSDSIFGDNQASTGLSPESDRLVTHEDFQFWPGSTALGFEVRGPLSTFWLNEVLPEGMTSEWLGNYHFGVDNNYAIYGNEVDFDQLTLGFEPEYDYAPSFLPIQFEPYVYAAAGGRLERIKLSDAPTHRFGQSTAGGAVVQGGLGLRLRLYDSSAQNQRWYQHLWLGYAYNVWFPYPLYHITSGSDHAALLEPGHGGNYSLGLTCVW